MSKLAKFQETAESLSLEFSRIGVELCLELKPVKNVNFRYHHPRLKVSAPKHISTEHLSVLVLSRLDWAGGLFKKHADRQNSAVKNIFSSDLQWGDLVRFWGEDHTLVLPETSLSHAQANTQLTLALKLGPEASSAELQQAYQQVLKQSLRVRLDQRLDYWGQKTGLWPSATRIKLMRSRWGSCSQRSRCVSISLAIAMYDHECLDALIVHELCHLVHANHGRHFWALVYHYLPEYPQIHSRLR